MSTTVAIVIISTITLFTLLAAFIVHKTGGTKGLAELGTAVGAIIAAFLKGLGGS